MSRYDHRDYVSITLEFRCNLKCEHCMIEGTMNWLKPESPDRFESLLQYNREHRKWKGLILTGSEITLHHDLPAMARRARQAGFQHVRIQTHGMHLAQKSYCRKLVDAGVDEFFVSVAGPDENSHDNITGMQGSFARTLQGLENIEEYEHVASITNTVVTKKSYRLLPEVVDRLSHLTRLTQMEYWVYWPMSEHDDKDLIARHTEVLPYLREAIVKAREYGRGVEVKNFPECLLGDEGHALVNIQPQLFIDPAFWNEFGRNGFYQCVYREQCGSKECLGLNTAYIKKYGLEQHCLQPLRPSAKRNSVDVVRGGPEHRRQN